jgi:hypothetical protein
MKQVISFFKRFRLGQLLTVFIAGLALFLTTACNNGNMQGARPNNPPVQLGGQNNPHKAGGDGYSEYKMTTDPNAVQQKRGNQDRASLPGFDQLIAATGIESNASDMLYPGSDATRTNSPDIGPRGQQDFARQAREVPAQPQKVIDRSDPDSKILEKVGEAFQDASKFVQDTFEEVEENPAPYQQKNPALGR